MRQQHHRGMRAFTLIEILVVVVILGIAGAIIIPQMSSRDDLRVSAASRILMADLIYAQNMSITRQVNHCVVFDIAGSPRSYWVARASALNTPITHPVNKVPYRGTFGAGGTGGLANISLNSARFDGTSAGAFTSAIGFDELGTPLMYNSDGTYEVLSQGAIELQAGAQKMRIAVEPYTGQITITNVP